MKSEHRHELAENDLSKLIDHGRDRIEPYRNAVLIGLLVATVLVIGGIVVYRTQSAKAMVGAAELAEATTPDEYTAVADQFPGTETGLWARLRAGEGQLREGIRLSLTNRSASNESLEQAQKSLETVLKSENVPPEIGEQALFSLAVCLESLTSQQTTTKPAIEAYQRLLTKYKESRYKARAEARIKELEKPRSEEFYAWFHAQNPKPEDRPRPMDLNNMPFDFSQDTSKPADMPADAAPAGDAQGTGPALEAPATDTPATDAPATDAPATTPEASAPATDPAAPATESSGPALPSTPESTPATEAPANP
jgi:hypothetical protein